MCGFHAGFTLVRIVSSLSNVDAIYSMELVLGMSTRTQRTRKYVLILRLLALIWRLLASINVSEGQQSLLRCGWGMATDTPLLIRGPLVVVLGSARSPAYL